VNDQYHWIISRQDAMIVQLKADFEEKEKKSVKIKLSSASR
jgi:hypothetical protein